MGILEFDMKYLYVYQESLSSLVIDSRVRNRNSTGKSKCVTSLHDPVMISQNCTTM